VSFSLPPDHVLLHCEFTSKGEVIDAIGSVMVGAGDVAPRHDEVAGTFHAAPHGRGRLTRNRRHRHPNTPFQRVPPMGNWVNIYLVFIELTA
jgi:hypothetical protein